MFRATFAAALTSVIMTVPLAADQAAPLATVQAGATTSTPATPSGPRVSVITTVYDAEGRTPAVAGTNLSGDFTVYAYARGTGCQLYSARVEAPADAMFGWRVSGRVLSRTPSEMVIHVDWQRMWEGGRAVSGPSGARDITLHPADRVSLDSMTAPPGNMLCTGGQIALQVGFASESSQIGVYGGARGGGGRAGAGVASIPGIGSVAVGAGADAGPTTGSITFPGRGGGRAGGGGGYAGSGGAARAGGFGGGGGASAGSAGLAGARGGVPGSSDATGIVFSRVNSGLNASDGHGGGITVTPPSDGASLEEIGVDLWLVDGLPGRAEEAQQLSIRTTPGGGMFEFRPVTIQTPTGVVVVRVIGYVEAHRLVSGVEKLQAVMIRSTTSLADGVRSLIGGTKTVDMPRSGEVVAFDITDTAVAGASNLASLVGATGHQFSLRARVAR